MDGTRIMQALEKYPCQELKFADWLEAAFSFVQGPL
jgi:hypothetical protein